MEHRQQIEKLLRAVFGELREDDHPGFEKNRDEFVFHMTDWLDDLEDFLTLVRSATATKEAAARQIVGFSLPRHASLDRGGSAPAGRSADTFGETANPAGTPGTEKE